MITSPVVIALVVVVVVVVVSMVRVEVATLPCHVFTSASSTTEVAALCSASTVVILIIVVLVVAVVVSVVAIVSVVILEALLPYSLVVGVACLAGSSSDYLIEFVVGPLLLQICLAHLALSPSTCLLRYVLLLC